VTADERARLRALTDAATPGGWKLDDDGEIRHTIGHFSEFVAATNGGSNGQLIVAAHDAVPDLLDTIDAVLAIHKTQHYPVSGSTIMRQPIQHEALCKACLVPPPCATVRAIEGAS
jgi:hypothetical protein